MSNGNPMYNMRNKTYNDDDDHFKSVSTQPQVQSQVPGNPFNINRSSKVTKTSSHEAPKVVGGRKQEVVKPTKSEFTILNNVNSGAFKYSNNTFVSYPKAQPNVQDMRSINKYQSVQSQADVKDLYVAVLQFCCESRGNGTINSFQKARDNSWELYIYADEYESVVCFSIDRENKNKFVELKRLSGFGGFSFNNLLLNLKQYLVDEKLVVEDQDMNTNTSEDETKEEEPQFGFFAAGYVSSDDETDTE